jgi:nitrite reductase/ring-hydroxylating ferredoxin subunit
VTFLCRVDDLAHTGAKSVILGQGANRLDVVIVERGGARFAYVNECPHQFIPLETFPDHFFTEDRRHLICSGHSAMFVPETGLCIEGPCEGDRLASLAIVERDGAIYLNETMSPEQIAASRKVKRNW